jgi:hypothetical protein
MLIDVSVDMAHVVLDAVNTLRKAMQEEGYKPWRDYEFDESDSPADPKTEQVDYQKILNEAAQLLSNVVAEG